MREPVKFTCPDCFGDGKETCHNPDHGFIDALSFHDIGRLGCPVCGHHPKHKVKGGANCDTCHGAGTVDIDAARFFCEGQYDFEDIMSQADPAFYDKLSILGKLEVRHA